MSDTDSKAEAAATTAAEKRSAPREIPGNFPFTTSHGVFKDILSAIIKAERPPKFSRDFLQTVLKFTGGSATVVPPILKRMGFINSDGSPTDLYNRFKSDSGRSSAALEALRKGYGELFKRNEYAYKLNDNELKDLLVEITGLNKSDGVIRAIAGTFGALRSFIDLARLTEDSPREVEPLSERDRPSAGTVTLPSQDEQKIGLVYNINVVLPVTDDPAVLNAIFRSLRENLLR